MVSEGHSKQRWLVAIDEGLCIGAGTCAALAPDVFQSNVDGTRVLALDVPVESTLQDAAQCCPVQAITLSRVQSGTPVSPGKESDA